MRSISRSRMLAGRAAGRITVRAAAICIVFLFLVARTTLAGTFGTVVPIGGHASDIALDEGRGVVYVANFTANRIDVVSIADRRVQRSIAVERQPASVALSPDHRYLVITHVSNFEMPPPSTEPAPYFGVTVRDLNADSQQTYTFSEPPLGVAFGNDGQALIVTTKEFLLFDPAMGSKQTIDTVEGVTTRTLPQPIPTSPREIIGASLAASGDGARIFGAAEMNSSESDVLVFEYSVPDRRVVMSAWTAQPPLGPRVVSTDQTGSVFLAGWGLFHPAGFVLAQFPQAEGLFEIGSHAIDASRNRIYAQVAQGATQTTTQQTSSGVRSAAAGTTPILLITDGDNLTVRERLKLPENLSGRSILDSSGNTMYSTSESGLMILPVGFLNQEHRIFASVEDLLFTGQWCDRNSMMQEFAVENPGGGSTDFTVVSSSPGVTVTASSPTTPARVTVTVDMTAFQSRQGTTAIPVEIRSANAVNVIPQVRVLVNNREPDQRGTIFSVSGNIVDIQADPFRNRFYVMREDRNEVRVFDADHRWIWTFRTGNTPWSMAMTRDGQYLITTADNSQVAHVFNLDTMQFEGMIIFPAGHYPRSIAVSNGAILAASRVAGEKNTIDQIDLGARTATQLPTLGIFENDIDPGAMLSSSPSGSSIFIAQPNGKVMLYSAGANTFVAGRQEYTKLQGTAAALSDQTFAVDRYLLNSSLVTNQALDTSLGIPSGFVLPDGTGLRTGAQASYSPGIAQRVSLADGTISNSVRLTEAPLLPGVSGHPFIRSLVTMPDGSFVSLSTSGFTALSSNFDAAVAQPRIDDLVNSADFTPPVAPGGLISIFGADLSTVSASSAGSPLPTLLGDTCMTVNGTLVPLSFVSPGQINGQLPFSVAGGLATLALHTPSGVATTFQFPVQPAAPAIFLLPLFGGWPWDVPAVVRVKNGQMVTPSNPVHLDDWLEIYATGLGAVTPAVETGAAAPFDPLAEAVATPEVRLGGVALPVGYAGLTPGSVGIYQINVKVPFKDVPTGMEIPLTITQGGYSTTVKVRVVN